MSVLVWFKRDLRLADHPALHHAMQLGDVVPIYIIEPEYWRLDDVSGRQYDFLSESLRALQQDLRALGSDLIIRVGLAIEQLDLLMRETAAVHLVSHEETGNAWTFDRDRCVARWARDRGVTWHQLAQCAVLRGAHDRDSWAVHRNRFMAQPILDPPFALPPVQLISNPIPDAASLGLQDICPDRQNGGRAVALQEMDSFLTSRGRTYRSDMSSPLTGWRACSRLSPHLALGTLSLREAVTACAARQRIVKGARDGWPASMRSFQSRLAWRDHFVQKLEDEPKLESQCLHSAYDGLRPVTPDVTRLDAWQNGETGVPFVDACMRSLNATGWLNFRMRSMVMSFASYHLWLPWQATGAHLARMFTDYEPGIHWSQCQMQSGTTGINTLRIYNPIKQGRDQDPTGAFTRHWCPELAHLPDAALHDPARFDPVPTYPTPIVDVPQAARVARDAVWAVRQQTGFANEAQRVVRKHASRKDPQRHFVNDRAARKPRSKVADTRQLSFDL